MPDPALPDQDHNAARRAWMRVLARAPAADIAALLARAPHPARACAAARARGRAGHAARPCRRRRRAFNLGEMTVTRCTRAHADGHVGHAYVAGRDARQAELAALVDAALQDPAWHDALHAAVIAPLAARQQAAARRHRAAGGGDAGGFLHHGDDADHRMSIDLPGFADPVLKSQACFRAVLDAMARPGALHVAGTGLAPPAPLVPSAAAVLLTLVDGETPLFAAPGFAPARDWIGFHCGAVPVGRGRRSRRSCWRTPCPTSPP